MDLLKLITVLANWKIINTLDLLFYLLQVDRLGI